MNSQRGVVSNTVMTLNVFIDHICTAGIKACNESYKNDPKKRSGAVDGFEACRGKTVFELRQQLHLAATMADAARAVDISNYWYHRCRHAEIEWVCNVVSAALQNMDQETIVTPTARGYLQAAAILGVTKGLTLNSLEN